jgi:DnaK suppressor protein
MSYKSVANETYMSAKQQAYFRARLEDQQQQISKKITEQDTLPSNIQAATLSDAGDEASYTEALQIALAARERDHKILVAIALSLKKLLTGEYGYCAVCDEEIGMDRLEAQPIASQCISCKTREELQQKQMGHPPSIRSCRS